MNRENLRVWTAALRSGRFPQGKQKLARYGLPSDPTPYYCCMGVGCEKAGLEQRILAGGEVAFGGHGATGYPPRAFHEWLGLSLSGNLSRGDVYIDWPPDLTDYNGVGYTANTNRTQSCSLLNDSLGLTFPQIADLLDYFGVRTP